MPWPPKPQRKGIVESQEDAVKKTDDLPTPALRAARRLEVVRKRRRKRLGESVPARGASQKGGIVGIVEVDHLHQHLGGHGVSLEDRRKPHLTATDDALAHGLVGLGG